MRTADAGLAIGRHLPGRGAWLCPGVACVDRAVGRRSVERALRGEVRPDAVAALRAELAGRARMEGRRPATSTGDADDHDGEHDPQDTAVTM